MVKLLPTALIRSRPNNNVILFTYTSWPYICYNNVNIILIYISVAMIYEDDRG